MTLFADPPPPAPRHPTQRALQSLRGSSILRSSSALYSSTVVTSALGFAFWALSARMASPDEVGLAAAAIPLMLLMGSLGTLGLGSLLIAELSRRPEQRVQLVSAAVALAATVSFLASVVVGGVLGRVTDTGYGLLDGGWGLFLFAFGASMQTVCQVVDYALVGARLPGRQLMRNAVASGTKVLILPLLALSGELTTVGIYAAWTVGSVVSLLAVIARSTPATKWLRVPAGPRTLSGLGWAAAGHHAINLSGHSSALVLPMIVVGLLGPTQNASFYIAMQVASFAWAVPLHMGTALFAVSASDHAQLRREVGIVLRVAAAVTVAGVLFCLVFGRFTLGLFGSQYADAAPMLTLLLAGTFPMSVLACFVTACRITGRLGRAAATMLGESAMQVALGACGAAFGLIGVGAGYVLPGVLLAIAVWPRLARVRDSGRHEPDALTEVAVP